MGGAGARVPTPTDEIEGAGPSLSAEFTPLFLPIALHLDTVLLPAAPLALPLRTSHIAAGIVRRRWFTAVIPVWPLVAAIAVAVVVFMSMATMWQGQCPVIVPLSMRVFVQLLAPLVCPRVRVGVA